MIDLTYNRCECGNPDCDYDPSLPICEEQQVIAEVLVLESPILRLVKERNEARELVKRVLMATEGLATSKEYYDALLAARRAAMTWKGGAK
jgi:hypothetical protein